MNSNKSNTLAVVAIALASSAISQVSAANITLGPGTTTVTTSANQFMGIGTGNIFDGTYPQFAVGESNEFDAESSGIGAGWANILGYGSYASILVGQSNFADAPFSAIFGESNSIVQDPLVGWNPSNLISGSYNEMEGFMTSTILGSDNDLVFVTRPGGGNVGVSSLVVGQSNQFEGGVGWIIGYLNEASGDASSTFGWGLLNPGFAATVVGTFNEEIESSPSSHEEDGAAFVVGNGTYNSRSNAIETLKNGETTLINKAWNSADPLGVPAATDSADGNALVVDGHTVLNGKVIISEPQGDISMGIYE